LLKYEFFDVMADVGFRAWGENLEEAFENAALALFEVITDTSQIKPETEMIIKVESEDVKALLYDWLAELIFLHDVEFIIFSKFKVNIFQKSDNKYLLEAQVWGEKFQIDFHERRDEVKAVTYHLMEVQKEEGFRLQVILDV
jgi:SHS2 domain-containing protein